MLAAWLGLFYFKVNTSPPLRQRQGIFEYIGDFFERTLDTPAVDKVVIVGGHKILERGMRGAYHMTGSAGVPPADSCPRLSRLCGRDARAPSELELFSMDGLSSSLAVLTAMITPAVLISASGTMILSTSTRLGRVVDRVRSLSDRLRQLANSDGSAEFFDEERAMLYDQLDKLTSRSRLLQRALTTFYLAVGVFVATSVAIGVVAFFGGRASWIPVAMGLIGAFFLFYGSMLLVFEARLALSTTPAEMDFIWRTSKRFVPRELVEQHKTHHVHFRKKKER